MRARGPSPPLGCTAKGVSARKRRSHSIWLGKPAGIVSEKDKGMLEAKALLLKGPSSVG